MTRDKMWQAKCVQHIDTCIDTQHTVDVYTQASKPSTEKYTKQNNDEIYQI